MKVFVTGGTGFVGREIVQQLIAASHKPRLLVRDPESPAAQALRSRYDIEVAKGDVTDPRALPDAISGCDAVIHLVGIISEVGNQTFENIHVRGTENVVRAAQMAGARRYIHMSALGTRPNAPSRYHQTKWAAEEIVRHSGLAWTIFRPSIIYGRDDQFVNMFLAMARFSPVLPLIGGHVTKFQPIAVQDVAACFVKALTEPRAVGQTFDLCGPETLTLEEILRLALKVTGRKRLLLKIPLWLARTQAAILEHVYPRLLGKAPPLNRDQLLMLQEDNVGTPAPAIEVFNLTPHRFSQEVVAYASAGVRGNAMQV
ncbi:MAG: complex I NDUFA9 subunit family protein [Verrucomicrobiae bacterium]|nr:complex I NDUFA9 subunit family protein [Verrucomicrobiae bacterium]